MKANVFTSYGLRVALLLSFFVFYLAIPNARPDFTRFNAHDSESYLALSSNMLHEGLYTRSLDGENYIPHTLWPPGMPLIVMPAVPAEGEIINWFWVKAVMIFWGMVGVVFSWLYIKTLSGSVRLADVGALLIVLNPYYWHFSHVAMAEVPIFVWAIASLYFAHRMFSGDVEVKLSRIFWVGAIIGLGTLIKGVLLGLVFIPLGYFFKKGLFEKQALFKSFIFALGFCLTFVAWGLRNSQFDTTHLGLDGVKQVQMMFKEVVEDPDSPYRDFGSLIETAKQNIFWYGIYNLPSQTLPLVWLTDLKSLPGSVLWGGALSLLVGFLAFPRKKRYIPNFLLVAAMVFMLMLIAIGGSERYWVAISLLCIVLMVCQLPHLFRSWPRWVETGWPFAWPALISAICLVSLVPYIAAHEKSPYHDERDYESQAALFQKNRGLCLENPALQSSNVFTENVHAFTLMTGCKASMSIPRAGFDPLYTHAIIDTSQSESSMYSNYPVLSQQGPLLLLELEHPLTSGQIRARFYK